MDRRDKCDVSKAHMNSNCRKLDTSDVKGRLLNKIDSVHLKKFESEISNSFKELWSLTFQRFGNNMLGNNFNRLVI